MSEKVFNIADGDEYTIMGEKVTGVNKIIEYTIDDYRAESPEVKVKRVKYGFGYEVFKKVGGIWKSKGKFPTSHKAQQYAKGIKS